MLECRVLGPVGVTADGVAVEVGGALPRRLVAALALADGMAVSDDRLAQAMWDDQPPAKAAAAMQAYVSRIRSALGPSYRDRLGTIGGSDAAIGWTSRSPWRTWPTTRRR